MVETTYTVNLISPVPESLKATVALQLAEKFNVSIGKMNRLLMNGRLSKRMPRKLRRF
jgi:uncharacterized protein YhhL (DUF1145 family)